MSDETVRRYGVFLVASGYILVNTSPDWLRDARKESSRLSSGDRRFSKPRECNTVSSTSNRHRMMDDGSKRENFLEILRTTRNKAVAMKGLTLGLLHLHFEF